MDSLNHEKQIEYAGHLLRDEARSGSAEQCAVVLTVASGIISGAIDNNNIRSALYSELYSAQRAMDDVLRAIDEEVSS